MKWGFIGITWLALWFQGLFWGWESSLFLMMMGLLVGCMAFAKIPVQLPKTESLILGLLLLGYGFSLCVHKTNADLILLIQMVCASLWVLVAYNLMNGLNDWWNWYRAFQWNVCALLLIGWLIRGNGLLESVFDYANLVAALCLVVMFFSFPLLFKQDDRNRWLSIVLFVFFSLSLLATGARIAWAIAVVSLLLEVFVLFGKNSFGKGKLFWLGGVVVLASTLLYIWYFQKGLWEELTQLSSLRIRLTYDWDALRIAWDHPFLGVGAEGWNKLQFQYQTALYSVRHIHNHFLQLWLEGGFLALAGWGVLIWILIRDYPLIRRCSDKQQQVFILSTWLSTVVIIGYSSLDFILSYPAMFCIVLLYLPFRRMLHPQDKQQVQYVVPKGVMITLSLVAVIGGVVTGYREFLVKEGESALANGYLRSVLRYEDLPQWSIPATDRALLLGNAYIEKAKRTHHSEDWQKGLRLLEEGIGRDPADPRFYPPAVYSSIQLKKYDQAVNYATQLIHLQPRVVANYELYAEALHLAGADGRVLQIPQLLSDQKQEVYQEALFKRHIPALQPTDRLQQLIQESTSP